MSQRTGTVTEWLVRLRAGHPEAKSALIELVYSDMHRLARNYMRKERPWHTLQPTELINEVYVRMVDQPNRTWQNRPHFLAAAAQAMRRILVDYARMRETEKRGGGAEQIPLNDQNVGVVGHRPENLIALDRALDRLSEMDPELAQLVEWRFFGGLSEEEAAGLLNVSSRTVKRRWSMARAWLLAELSGQNDHPAP
jgi:RNA polymerase sigma-70 factor, ECF subfamily